MVNLVHVAKKQLVQRLAKMAGLRQRAIDVDDAGTVISIWVPKDKLPAGPTAEEMETERRKKETKRNGGRLSVVLLHGFAGDGILTWVLQVVLAFDQSLFAAASATSVTTIYKVLVVIVINERELHHHHHTAKSRLSHWRDTTTCTCRTCSSSVARCRRRARTRLRVSRRSAWRPRCGG